MKQRLPILMFVLGLFLPFSNVSAGAVLNSHKYAWSNNVGYINFEGVTVGDSALGGYALSANKGFIKFDPARGGVLNDGAGNLSGFAWGEQLGWIDFNNVSIDSNGKFSGTATGALAGTITFDCPNYCDVATDWRPAAAPPAVPPGEGGIGGQFAAPAPAPAIPIRESAVSTQAKLIDIVKDGIINILDFNALMVNWDSTDCGNPADMDNDCSVGIFDFNILMVYWNTAYQL
jgi:hypothetical protein